MPLREIRKYQPPVALFVSVPPEEPGGDGVSVTSGGCAAGHGRVAKDGEHAADLVR